jgi:ABC-type sugar transport system substrate-binding protein
VNISTDSIKLAMQLADKAAAGQPAEYKGSTGKVLGVVMPQFDNEGFRAQYIGILSEAIQANWSVTTFDAHLDADKQISMIEDLITKKVDAIVFTPVDSAALSKAVQEANAANIPIVADDRSTTGGNVTALVESDNVKHGEVSADMMLAAFQKAGLQASNSKVLDLLGDQATSAGVEREKGFVTEAAKDGLTIVTSLPTYWDNDAANGAVLDAFQANPQINAIYSASGCAMLAGIEAAMKSVNKWQKIGDPNHIILVDIDGCPISLQAIRDGYLDADVAQRIPLMGGLGAMDAINAASGNPPTVKDLLLPPDPITKDNVDDIVHWANALVAGGYTK